jgi:hypothetical protein
MSTAQPSPLAIPLTMRSSAAASNLIFLPPPHLLTTLCRLRLNSSVPFHGPSCPSPSRPTPARICHLSPVIRSARPTCRTVRSTPPAIHTVPPLRLILTPSTLTSRPLFISHHIVHIPSAALVTGHAPFRTSVLYLPPQSSPSRHVARTLHAAHRRRSARSAVACARAYAISHPPHVPGVTALTPGRYDHSSIHLGVSSSEASSPPVRSRPCRRLTLHCPFCRSHTVLHAFSTTLARPRIASRRAVHRLALAPILCHLSSSAPAAACTTRTACSTPLSVSVRFPSSRRAPAHVPPITLSSAGFHCVCPVSLSRARTQAAFPPLRCFGV